MSSGDELNPDFPVIEGRVEITDEWAVAPPTPMNRRVEKDARGRQSLVLWRPGLTAWITYLQYPTGRPRGDVVASMRRGGHSVPPEVVRDVDWGGLAGYWYPLDEPRESGSGAVHALQGFLAGTTTALIVAIYFDEIEDSAAAADLLRAFDCAE